MSKINTDVIKKSTKHLMMISSIAILVMVAMSGMPILNTSALDYYLISNDNNSGSIETHSVYNCVGEAKTCVNTNQNNNNEINNKGEVTTSPP